MPAINLNDDMLPKLIPFGDELFVDFEDGLTIYDGSPDRVGYFIPSKQFKLIVKLIVDLHEVNGGSIKDWFAA